MTKDGPRDPKNPVSRDGLLGETRGKAAGAGRYEIRVREILERRWSEWFEDLELTNSEGEGTTLSGMLADQAALHGVLARIRDLNLTLLSVELVEIDHDRKRDERSRG